MSLSKLKRNNLPHEITEAILHRLPAKSLGRFKSVSKTWNSLISHAEFIAAHRERHQTSKLILLSDTKSLFSININKLLPYFNNNDIPATVKEISLGSIRWENILGSCNGLILAKDEKNSIFIVNPTTKELWKVPANPLEEGCFVMYGFSYVSSTGDYKVVALLYIDDELNPGYPPMFVSVYSLRSNLWKNMNTDSFPINRIISSSGCVFVNQNFHWFTLLKSLGIVVFSLANEVFNEIKLPDCIEVKSPLYNFNLIEVGGKLNLYLGFGESIELWVMNEYGVSESWTKIFIHGLEMIYSPVCWVERSNQDIVLGGEGEVVVYNTIKRTCKNVRIIEGPTEFVVRGKYVESLESPKRIISTTSQS